MATSSNGLRGVVHGSIIQLEQPPGLPDGQIVTVSVCAAKPDQSTEPGEGIRRSAGAWADDQDGLDEYLEFVRQERKTDRCVIDP